MNTKREVILDRLVAKPVAYLLNFIVRLLGKLLRINHDLRRPFDVLVICKFKGLGSIIQSTPMLQALRELHPQAKIVYVSTRSNLAFLEKIPMIDEVILLDDRSVFRLGATLFRAILRLWKLRPGVYIDLEIYSSFSTLVALFSLSKNRIGYYLRSSSFRRGIYTHMMFFNTTVPISEAYMQNARLLGWTGESPGLFPLISSTEGAVVDPELYMVINVNASDLRIERRWPAEKFVTLLNRLLQLYPDHRFYLIGAPSEAEYVAGIKSALPSERVLDVSGKTSASELVRLIAFADKMVTNDTGPMHLAFSSDTPVVCLFGPCAPDQYGGRSNIRILYKHVYCSPCVHEFTTPPCLGNNLCMQLIEVDEVVNAIAELSEESALFHRPVIYTSGDAILGTVANRPAN